MTRLSRTVCLAFALLLLVATGLGGCTPQDSYSGRWILDGQHRLESGQVLEGELLVTGGQMNLEPGSLVTGSVNILAGEVAIGGTVQGNVAALGGTVRLQPEATVGGDLRLAGGQMERSSRATVLGRVETSPGLPGASEVLGEQSSLNPVGLAVQTVLLALLAFLLARFLPGPLTTTQRAAVEHPVVCGAVGLLFLIVFPALLVQMLFTIVLIPLTVLGILVVLLLITYGGISIGLALGQWLSRLLRRELSLPAQALLGTALLVPLSAVLVQIPVLGLVLIALLGSVASGAVLLTRLGARRFVPVMERE